MLIFSNKKISKIPNIHAFLNSRSHHKTIIGWGRKPSYFRAKAYAEKHKLQCISLEDGFIRSLGLGKEGYPPLSLVVDESGIYFGNKLIGFVNDVEVGDEVIELGYFIYSDHQNKGYAS